MNIYRSIVRPVLFSGLKADPEWLHQQTLSTLGWLDQQHHQPSVHWLQKRLATSYCLMDDRLAQSLWGLSFCNPIGLAAGFDKDGVASGVWSSFGFGFAELGTVTFSAQPGNALPRLFRLPLDHAALNRMGFNNQGAARLADVLQERWRDGARSQASQSVSRRESDFDVSFDVSAQSNSAQPNSAQASTLSSAETPNEVRSQKSTQNSKYLLQGRFANKTQNFSRFPIGINLGKSKVTLLEDAAADYVGSFKLLKDWGDYFVVNVSSPNTPGLRSLQAADQLEPILAALQQENTAQKPLLIKIAPDLEWDAIAAVLDLAQKHKLAGIIATNTTIRRESLATRVIAATGKAVQEEAGGISGAPLRQRSTEVIRFIWEETQGTLPIVGVGGVFTPEDAWEKITAGASLIQVYTGWIYEGPGMVRRILKGLLQKLDERGLTSLSQAIGLKE